MTIPLSTALTMSSRVSAATATGGQRFHFHAGLRAGANAGFDVVAARVRMRSTSTADSGSGWQSGISAAVCLAAMIPASRAACSGSPFFTAPRRIRVAPLATS